MQVSLEVCANSVTSALAAQEGGAVRVELCENLKDGGTTPSHGTILMARSLLHIKLYVLIRPRGGDFLYNDMEYKLMCADQHKALEEIIEMGCERVLTSGGKSTAIEGASNLNRLVEQAAGRISIMPGSGVSEVNVADLIHFTGATEVHSSARIKIASKMKFHNDHILMSNEAGDEYSIDVTGVDRVRELIRLANS